MPTGDAMQHIGGGDRGPLPCVTYGDPGRRKQVSIDWTATRAHATPDVAPAAVPPTACPVCGTTEHVSTYTGLCDLCAAGADPHRTTTPLVAVPDLEEAPMPEPTPTPAYSDQLAVLMAETEGHPDPIVRANRKIVAQAAVALRTALDLSAINKAARASASKDRAATRTKAVRAWARENGIDCPARGRIPGTVMDAFLAADEVVTS